MALPLPVHLLPAKTNKLARVRSQIEVDLSENSICKQVRSAWSGGPRAEPKRRFEDCNGGLADDRMTAHAIAMRAG